MAAPASKELINEVKEIFRNYLKVKKHRQTPERFIVLEEIYKADGHFDADDMYFRIKKKGTQVSRATVYNTLEILVECELVQRHHFSKNQSSYERSYAFRQHDHIICDECGTVMEFCDPRIHEIQTMMEKLHDFKISGHSLQFYGKCTDPENCAKRQ